ncbi:MAG TPA: 2-succinyl-5-enolpyruvyl-6-hydroxy-3-cyclohexene-1-carboxylic-acid synthase [Mycobacteriales bacterium]|nr:2-succinyl-5-enolpyruvyl-6-hydroxy-3-cyclohexene-1-carboxylic-acid synthase [Mycobacteriales bacterium]
MTAANAGVAFATVLVDELVRHGVTDAVLAPGSRSTPLALAFSADDRVRLHVRIDERSAAFLALGLVRASGRPVAVMCTSGTATAHFHAAVLEADQSRLPLLVLTADRPPELRGAGANQTVDQIRLYGTAVRWFCDAGVPEARAESVRYWRSLVARAVGTARGHSGGPAGPVHLNLPFREPLTADDDDAGFPYPLDGRADGAPWTATGRAGTRAPADLARAVEGAGRGVIVAGDGLPAADVTALVEFAERSGWPVIAEPHSNARRPSVAVVGTDALLRDSRFSERHAPDLVVVAGRVGLSRALLGWLAGQHYVVIDRDGAWSDPNRGASAVHRCDVTALADLTGRAGSDWAAGWRGAGELVAEAIDRVLDAQEEPTEPQVARDVAAGLPDAAALVVASSMPIRDLDLTMRPRSGLTVVANRGVSGIDGFVSTAQGVALGRSGPTWALAGDLSLLHDANGLAVADDPPAVTYVVINNNGGGIFSLLPQASSVEPTTFERVFGTPHDVDLATLVSAYGVGYARATTAAELGQQLDQPPKGLKVVEVRTDRTENAALHERLRQAAAGAVPQ